MLFASLGDREKRVSVLKLDVEGEEFNSLPQMLASNVFENIQQMHLEVTLFDTKLDISHYITCY